MTEPARTWTIRHYAPAGSDPTQVKAEVTALLRDMIRGDGCVIDYDTITPHEGVPITLTGPRGNYTGYVPWSGEGEPDGHIVEWTANATMPLSDDERADQVTTRPDGSVRAETTYAIRQIGGGMRVPHGLGGPVTLRAFTETGEAIGYHFTQPVSDDEEHAELLAGTAYVIVTRDEDES